MARTRTQFICRTCGAVQSKWFGKCPDCGAWDALESFNAPGGSASKDPIESVAAAINTPAKAQPITQVARSQDSPDGLTHLKRLPTGIGELDRVLGSNGSWNGESKSPNDRAGFVPGSTVLIGGDPGVGKSTLMLQAAHRLATQGVRVLYVTSEESAQQLQLRAARLGALTDQSASLFVLADTNLARIVEQVRQVNPQLVVIDSIQMVYKGDLPAAPGSVTQLRACCLELTYLAKLMGCAVVLVGHVTKEGRLAGPRLIEHMVDAVLYFEGDRYHAHRIVRAIKNRFGTTLEVGLFEMTGTGLAEVADGSGLLAAEYKPAPGSVVCPVLQGSRCLLIEIQALTATGFLGSAKRKVSGLDGNRLAMLIAVLEKRAGLRLADQDVFASSVGGMKVAEPAADLAVALAIAGAHHNRQLDRGVCAVGEVGLGGELRHVQQLAQRVVEAGRLGFKHVICPGLPKKMSGLPKGCELVPVSNLDRAIELLA